MSSIDIDDASRQDWNVGDIFNRFSHRTLGIFDTELWDIHNFELPS